MDTLNSNPLELIGMLGVTFYVVSYFLLQTGRLNGQGLAYVLMNLTAASLVLISLTKDFNLASALIQGFWITISVVGITRIALHQRSESSSQTSH